MIPGPSRHAGALTCAACAAVVLALALAGCGQQAAVRAVAVTDVPLPGGARILSDVRSCDRGANAYCSVQLVVVGSRWDSSVHLLGAEQRYLRRLGWSAFDGQTGKELAAQSPGNKLRVVYATTYNDLLALEMGFIKRRGAIARAMSSTIFDRTPAISLMLQRGSS